MTKHINAAEGIEIIAWYVAISNQLPLDWIANTLTEAGKSLGQFKLFWKQTAKEKLMYLTGKLLKKNILMYLSYGMLSYNNPPKV